MEDVGFPSPWACHPPFRPWMRHAMPANHISSRPWIIICFHHCWNNGTSCFLILEDCTGKHPRPVPQPHPKSSSMGTLVLRIDIRGLFKRHLCKYLRGISPTVQNVSASEFCTLPAMIPSICSKAAANISLASDIIFTPSPPLWIWKKTEVSSKDQWQTEQPLPRRLQPTVQVRQCACKNSLKIYGILMAFKTWAVNYMNPVGSSSLHITHRQN